MRIVAENGFMFHFERNEYAVWTILMFCVIFVAEFGASCSWIWFINVFKPPMDAESVSLNSLALCAWSHCWCIFVMNMLRWMHSRQQNTQRHTSYRNRNTNTTEIRTRQNTTEIRTHFVPREWTCNSSYCDIIQLHPAPVLWLSVSSCLELQDGSPSMNTRYSMVNHIVHRIKWLIPVSKLSSSIP